jgi:hypothetical protein
VFESALGPKGINVGQRAAIIDSIVVKFTIAARLGVVQSVRDTFRAERLFRVGLVLRTEGSFRAVLSFCTE